MEAASNEAQSTSIVVLRPLGLNQKSVSNHNQLKHVSTSMPSSPSHHNPNKSLKSSSFPSKYLKPEKMTAEPSDSIAVEIEPFSNGLKESEPPGSPKPALPEEEEEEEQPFLLRFPITSFGIALGMAIQALLWKNIARGPFMSSLHVSPAFNVAIWCVSAALMLLVASTYFLKVVFYLEAVKREFLHPFRVNFFFAPWIGCIFLLLSVPPSVAARVHVSAWYVLMVPVLCLELKIFGQWLVGGGGKLSRAANPSNHLAIVGSFAVSLLGSSVGLREGPVFFFTVGLGHNLVLLVTLFQQLPESTRLPKELHSVFFLFVAGPSIGSLAWTMIAGSFGLGSRIGYFFALFLYASLAVRVNFFRGFRFSLAWWAYTVPMTSVAIGSIKYRAEVDNGFVMILSVVLSFFSSLVVMALAIATVLHAFVFRTLFPNDAAIAFVKKKKKKKKKKKMAKWRKNRSQCRIASSNSLEGSPSSF